MFSTVLYNIKSSENTGILVRAHVALGGDKVVIVGPEPWHLSKRGQAFSRHLERLCEFVHCIDDDAFFSWCASTNITPIAVEIASPTTFLPGYVFPQRTALIVGSEGRGIPVDVLDRCSGVVTIPQYGPAPCLNVAMAGCMAMYELVRNVPVTRRIVGDAYVVEAYETEGTQRSTVNSPMPSSDEVIPG